MKVVEMQIDDLQPNQYNPNVLSDDEFAELIAEIKHTGQIAKPIIVRLVDGEHEIVDGEHNWKAAKEAGFTKVPCEIHELDDFEARRQTYKRNQHGTHDPVLEGRMFQSMLKDRKPSNRQLADELELSEGTIRNGLLYVAAQERVEAEKKTYWVKVRNLSVRQIRWFLVLPPRVAIEWAHLGGDIEALKFANPYAGWQVRTLDDIQNVAKRYGELDLLFDWAKWSGETKGFKAAMNAVIKIWDWESGFLHYHPVGREELRKYSVYHFHKPAFRLQGHVEILEQALAIIITKDSEGEYLFSIPPEQFKEILDESAQYKESYLDFLERLRLAMQEITGSYPKDTSYAAYKRAERRLEDDDVPDYIKASTLKSTEAKLALLAVKPNEGYWSGEDCTNLEEAKRRVSKRGAIWKEGSPGWTIEQAVNDQLVTELKRMEWEKAQHDMSNLDFAKEIVATLGIYADDEDKQKRGDMLATLEQLHKQELYVLWNAVRNGMSWIGRGAALAAALSNIEGA